MTTRVPPSLIARHYAPGLVLLWAISWGSFSVEEARGDSWVEVRSPAFVVISNASERRARRVAGEFEAFRQAVSAIFPGLEHDPSPIPIFALSTTDAMENFANRRMRGVGGFFRHGELGGEIVLGLNVETQHSFGILYHEYFHSVTRHSLPGFPLWLNEGLAEVLATSIIGDKQIQVGIVNNRYRRYLGESKLMNLDELVDPDLAAKAYTDRGTRPQFYAQAWALTHYFMMGDGGAHWPKLIQYLELLARGVDEESAWKQQFGSRRDVTKKLWRYLNRTKFSSRIIETTVAVDGSAFPVRHLTDAEALAYRGDFLTRDLDRALAGRLLSEATDAASTSQAGAVPSSPSGPALAYEGLGFLALRATLYDQAREHLERALELDPHRPRAHYHLATLERLQKTDGWQDRVERHLLDAVHAADWFAAAHFQLALHYAAVDATPARAVVVAKRSLKHNRGNALNHLLVAHLLRESGGDASQAVESVRFAVHLANTSSSSALANNVCWWGTLYELAEGVYESCDMAVRRAPDRAAYRDSRAVARAVTGNLEGAAEDLETFLADPDIDESTRAQRQAWLHELEQGRNPIDLETLIELREP